MLKEIKFQELRHYIAEWQTNQQKPDNAFGILMCIGYLRREELEEDERILLREIEIMVKNNIIHFIRFYQQFMEGSLLYSYAQKLLQQIDEEIADIFFQIRDEHQMSFDLLQEYVEELDHPTPVIKEVRNSFFKVDEAVIWSQEVVSAIQGLAFVETSLLDKEIYWWHDTLSYTDKCWIPSHLKNNWLAASLENSLDMEEEQILQSHIEMCEDCKGHYQWLQEIILGDSEHNTPIIEFPNQGLRVPYIQNSYELAASSSEDEKEICLLDGKIYGTVAKEESNIVYRIASQQAELKNIKFILQVGDETINCIFLPFGENELALFPLKGGKEDDFPEIIFPYNKNIQIENVTLFREL